MNLFKVTYISKFLIVAFLLVATTVSGSTVSAPTSAVTPSVEAKKAPRTIDELIYDISLEYGVSGGIMRKVIQCESNFNPNAIGDHGLSRGLVQIYKPAWPEITDEQAFDPEFAIRFLAEKLSNQQGYLWTCYRMLVQ